MKKKKEERRKREKGGNFFLLDQGGGVLAVGVLATGWGAGHWGGGISWLEHHCLHKAARYPQDLSVDRKTNNNLAGGTGV